MNGEGMKETKEMRVSEKTFSDNMPVVITLRGKWKEEKRKEVNIKKEMQSMDRREYKEV